MCLRPCACSAQVPERLPGVVRLCQSRCVAHTSRCWMGLAGGLWKLQPRASPCYRVHFIRSGPSHPWIFPLPPPHPFFHVVSVPCSHLASSSCFLCIPAQAPFVFCYLSSFPAAEIASASELLWAHRSFSAKTGLLCSAKHSLCLISTVGSWSKPLLCMKFLIWVEIGWGCIDFVQCLNSPFQLNSGQLCLLQSLAPGCPHCAEPLNKYVVGKPQLRAVLC